MLSEKTLKLYFIKNVLKMTFFRTSMPLIAVAGGIMLSGCPFVHTYVWFLWMWYLQVTEREFHQIWHKSLHGFSDELIRFWWSRIKVTVTNICRTPWGNFSSLWHHMFCKNNSLAITQRHISGTEGETFGGGSDLGCPPWNCADCIDLLCSAFCL